MIPGEATGHFDPNGIVTGGRIETAEERAWKWRRIQAAARNRATLRRVRAAKQNGGNGSSRPLRTYVAVLRMEDSGATYSTEFQAETFAHAVEQAEDHVRTVGGTERLVAVSLRPYAPRNGQNGG